MPSRRRVLGLAAGALTAASGCISPVLGGEPAADSDTTSLPEDGKTRGEADPITVERAITESDAKYIPSNDTVRYPASKSGGEVDEYGYISFEEWADIKTASVAGNAVQNQLAQEFEGLRLVSVGIANPRSEPLQVNVSHKTHLDESGDVVSEPSVSVQTLVDATPRSATVSIEFKGQSATRTHPVFVVWDAHVPLAVQEENGNG